ncbi:BZ3500_MvSof-1268-A1-R1_Chr11-3g03547 [Microbotryum saponariae]|uniref:Protein-lysine N-methyltransferase EFM4 n=1 Tax=Microbotryum saponariae TaxID=289078 RepID=A0A2X0NE11_9BASI|nr:BZ3500_MvSof-1268-A1-R1_Chr11-3g03547 [Microbotryum saponariae]SDA03556.1 BZ3501_MvSof-1269-A2-R1_Chr11g03124 [Microbotryum saponariae]
MPGPSLQAAVSWLAAHPDEAPALEAPLHPSKLGTKQHWDEVSHRRVGPIREDQGEVWFGEDASDKMVEWVQEHVPQTDANLLDLGTGNGQLLFRLSEEGYTSLTGIDYSPSSIELAESILSSTTPDPKPSINFFVSDILSHDPDPRLTQKRWKVLLDKGTYDAICLSDEIDPKEGVRIGELYPTAVAGLLDEEGYFLITSCTLSLRRKDELFFLLRTADPFIAHGTSLTGNWTRAELETAFITPQTGLIFHSLVPRPSFSFGGSTGSSITTIAFQKKKTEA